MPRPRKLSRLDTEAAMEMLDEGADMKSVCERFGVSPATVFRRTRVQGRETIPHRELDKSERFYVYQEYTNGSPVPQICVKWGISRATAYRIIAQARKDNAHDVHVEQGPAEGA